VTWGSPRLRWLGWHGIIKGSGTWRGTPPRSSRTPAPLATATSASRRCRPYPRRTPHPLPLPLHRPHPLDIPLVASTRASGCAAAAQRSIRAGAWGWVSGASSPQLRAGGGRGRVSGRRVSSHRKARVRPMKVVSPFPYIHSCLGWNRKSRLPSRAVGQPASSR
jgi:hypothetical protein